MAAVVEGRHFSTKNVEDSDAEFRLKDLMSKLRHKSNQLKSWMDTAKALRMAVTDKRYQSDALDRGRLQKSLDTLQKAIKVTTFSGMQERLEVISRQLGLKYNIQGSTIFISSDMFYVEVQEEPSGGGVRDVKITHEQWDPVSCPEMAKLLEVSDFHKFAEHLKGLIAIYSIVGDKKQKTKAYISLQSLEQDLNVVAQLQSSISGVANYIHKVLGILQPRQGGQPMKLTYFVAPYDLLNSKTKTSYPLTVEAITEHDLGHSATVVLEKSAPQKLQNMPLITIQKHDSGKLPSFAPLTHLNSATLPAIFVLKLQKPVPVCTALLRDISGVAGPHFMDKESPQLLADLLAQNVSGGRITSEAITKGLHVALPGQNHRYFINMSLGVGDVKGVVVKEVPFIHPTAVPQILTVLRQQLLFNTLIGSCIRPGTDEDIKNSLVFEVTAMSLQLISVTFEHPLDDSTATVDFDLSDITSVKCKLFSTSPEKLCTDELATKVVQRCLSIPVTMRAILRCAVADLEKQLPPIADVPTKAIGQQEKAKYTDSPFFCSRQYMSLIPNGQGFAGYSHHSIPTASASTFALPDQSLLGLPLPNFSLHQGSYPIRLHRQCSSEQLPITTNIEHPRRMPNHQMTFPSPTQGPKHSMTPSSFNQRDNPAFFPPASRPSEGILAGTPAQKTEEDCMTKNPMLSSLLDQDTPVVGNNSILSSLLGDNTEPPVVPMPKTKKPRRRRTLSTEQCNARSPKRRRTDVDDLLSPDTASNPISIYDFPATGSESIQQMSPRAASAGHRTLSVDSVPDEHKSTTEIAAILNKNSMSSSTVMTIGKLGASVAPPGSTRHLVKLNQSSSIEGAGEESELQAILERDSPLNPEMFSAKDSGTFTPSDFIGQGLDTSGNVKESSGESLDFTADILNTNVIDNLSEPGEGSLDLDACDANAFGTGITSSVAVSKLTLKTDSKPSESVNQLSSSLSSDSAKSTQQGETISEVANKDRGSNSKSPLIKPDDVTRMDKKDKSSKDGKIKERKKSKSVSSDKGERRLLKSSNVSVRFVDKSVDLAQETDDLCKKEKPLKVTIRTYPELPKESLKAEEGSSARRDAECASESEEGANVKTVIVPKPDHSRQGSLDAGRKRLEPDEALRKRKRSEDLMKKDKGAKKKRDEGRTLVDPSKSGKTTSGEKLPTRIKITTSGGKIKISSTPRSAMDQSKTSPSTAKPPLTFSPAPASRLSSLPRIPKLSQRQSSTGECSPKLSSTNTQVSSSPLAPKVPLSPLKIPQSPARLNSSGVKSAPLPGKNTVRMQSLLRPSPPVAKVPLLPTPTQKSPVATPSPRFQTPQPSRRSSSSLSVVAPDTKDSKLISKTPTIKLKPIPVPHGSELSTKPRDPRISHQSSSQSIHTAPVASKPSSTPTEVNQAQPAVQPPSKARGRKGSLTAVIDKLTKGHPGPGESAPELSPTMTAPGEGKRNIFDSLSSAGESCETSKRPDSENREKRETDDSQAIGKEEDTAVPAQEKSPSVQCVVETPESPPVEETTNIRQGAERKIPVDPVLSSPAHTKIESAPSSPDPEPEQFVRQKTVEIPTASQEAESAALADVDDAMFKAPTPKTPQSVGNRSPKAGDMPEFGGQSSVQMRSRSNSVTSSHPSSPEDGLIIACSPGTPKTHHQLSPSRPVIECKVSEPALPSESARSPMPSTATSAPSSKSVQSAASPASLKSPSAPLSEKSMVSPCMIDDDLMDEALMGFGN